MGRLDCRAARSVPCGAFISSTMIVMMMAMTPSVKASSRPFSIRSSSAGLSVGDRRPAAAERPVELDDSGQLGAIQLGELELSIEQARVGVQDLTLPSCS